MDYGDNDWEEYLDEDGHEDDSHEDSDEDNRTDFEADADQNEDDLANYPALKARRALYETAREAFGEARPELVCEPGRGLCAEAFVLAAKVKAIRDGEHVFINDGVYGSLTELPIVQ